MTTGHWVLCNEIHPSCSEFRVFIQSKGKWKCFTGAAIWLGKKDEISKGPDPWIRDFCILWTGWALVGTISRLAFFWAWLKEDLLDLVAPPLLLQLFLCRQVWSGRFGKPLQQGEKPRTEHIPGVGIWGFGGARAQILQWLAAQGWPGARQEWAPAFATAHCPGLWRLYGPWQPSDLDFKRATTWGTLMALWPRSARRS